MRERVRKRLVMPDLKGLRVEDAQVLLTSSGFQEARVRFVESYETLGTVVDQHPLKGQLVQSGGLLEIQVAKRSYLRFLPQIFQVESDIGNSFLREFMWVFHHITESLTDKLSDGHRYYEPLNTPEPFLSWLASWVALSLDVDWPEVKKRKLIRAAAELYQYRGTRKALREALKIFIGKKPTIVENDWPYDGFRIGVSSTMGEDTVILPPIDLDYCFVVRLPFKQDEITEEMVVKVHNIINMERPAHTMYFLQFETEEEKAKPQVFMQIGAASTIGMVELRYDEEEGIAGE